MTFFFKSIKNVRTIDLPKPNLNPSANLELALWNTQALSMSLWNFKAASPNYKNILYQISLFTANRNLLFSVTITSV